MAIEKWLWQEFREAVAVGPEYVWAIQDAASSRKRFQAVQIAMVASAEGVAVKRCEVASTIPTLEFFERDAFNIVGDACLIQPGLDAGNCWCERMRIH